LTVSYTITGTATNGVDYAALTGTVVIPAGNNTAPIDLAPIDDFFTEGVETVIVTINDGAAYDVGVAAATLSILDDDAAPTVSLVATDPNASEVGPDVGTFQVVRTGSTALPLDVSVAIAGTATNGLDYTLVSSTVTIPAGQAFVNVDITPTANDDPESAETVTLSLQPSANYTVSSGVPATVTIQDGDTVSNVVQVVALGDASETNSDREAFRIGVPVAPTQPLTVNYTLSGSATNGTDYVQLPGQAVIPAGSTFVDVFIDPFDDTLVEGTEIVILTATAGTGYTVDLGQSTASLLILDNDVAVPPTPRLSVFAVDPNAAEGPPVADGRFRILSDTPVTAVTNVTFTLAGIAVNGTDYNNIPLTAVLNPGDSFVDVVVTPIDDGFADSPETVILTLTDAVPNNNYDLGTTVAATVTITNDDPTLEDLLTSAAIFDLTEGNDNTFLSTGFAGILVRGFGGDDCSGAAW